MLSRKKLAYLISRKNVGMHMYLAGTDIHSLGNVWNK